MMNCAILDVRSSGDNNLDLKGNTLPTQIEILKDGMRLGVKMFLHNESDIYQLLPHIDDEGAVVIGKETNYKG